MMLKYFYREAGVFIVRVLNIRLMPNLGMSVIPSLLDLSAPVNKMVN